MENEDEYRDYDESGSGKAVGIALGTTLTLIATLVIFIICVVCCASCSSPKTVYVPQEVTKIEYRDRDVVHFHADTLRDIRTVFIKGDTIIDYRDRHSIQRVEIHDTIRTEINDTIREPYPVERPLSRWEQAKMDVGGLAMGACVVLLALLALRLRKKVI